MMKSKSIQLFGIALLLVWLAACVGTKGNDATSQESAGDAAEGKSLFYQATIGDGDAPGCVTCHSLELDVVIVGPSQAGLATRAGTRVPNQSAEEYIRNSIIEPNAYIVDGFAEGGMYQNYATDLSAEQIDDLVAFALTLK